MISSCGHSARSKKCLLRYRADGEYAARGRCRAARRCRSGDLPEMSWLARWARKFGVARAVCLVLLFALIPLRLADPRPLQEVRARTFDLFQVLRPRQQTI